MPAGLDHLDGRRLAEAAELASSTWPAAADREACASMLGRLCAIVDAAHGVVRTTVATSGHDFDVSWGTPLSEPRATVDVGLMSAAHGVGTLELSRAAGRPFLDGERMLVELISPRFALVLERQRLSAAEAAAREATAQAIALLRQKEERFEAMVDGSFDLIGLTALDGSVLEVNRAALQLIGAQRADVVGRPFWDTPWWSHDRGQQQRLRETMRAAAAGTPSGFEATHVAVSGETVVVDFAVRPVKGDGGATIYLVVEGRDVTTRSREHDRLARTHDELAAQANRQAGRLADVEGALEVTEAMHRAVVETIVDGIAVIDERGTVHWTNTAATRMFGYGDGELVGKNISILMPTDEAARHDGYLRRYGETGERKIIGIGREVRGRRKDGSEFPLYLAVGETSVNGVRRFTGIVRDLSETKRLEHLLQERQTLARIGELASVVAHEVRNPLAAIRGVVEVIQTRFPADSSDRKVLGDLLTRVDSLDQLVSDLLVYARPAPPVFRRARVLTLVRDTAALASNDPASTELVFDVHGDDEELWLDPAQMGRAVLNLLTNAAQAIRRRGVVRVVGARDGDVYRLSFIDEGPGMPDDVRGRCLEPFFTTKTRGTGLGLPIAKRVIDEHGGRFEIHSVPGDGTEVTIELPLAVPAAAE